MGKEGGGGDWPALCRSVARDQQGSTRFRCSQSQGVGVAPGRCGACGAAVQGTGPGEIYGAPTPGGGGGGAGRGSWGGGWVGRGSARQPGREREIAGDELGGG